MQQRASDMNISAQSPILGLQTSWSWARAAAALLLMGASAQVQAGGSQIRTSDVERFYALYEATDGKPSAEQLQSYIDEGTDGLRTFAAMRKTTGGRIAQAIEMQPEMYVNAKLCMIALPAIKTRLEKAMERLRHIYPEARMPPITIAVGRGKPVGTADENGVMIGLEALCATPLMHPEIEDRFVHNIAHEYVHVQQAKFFGESPDDTVLKVALEEGGAELIGELVSGSIAYAHLPPLIRGREREFEKGFRADLERPAIGSEWLYNHPGSAEHPADMGYWFGYRIVKAYYQRAKDKRKAIRDIIELRDPNLFLNASGWKPGMKL